MSTLLPVFYRVDGLGTGTLNYTNDACIRWSGPETSLLFKISLIIIFPVFVTFPSKRSMYETCSLPNLTSGLFFLSGPRNTRTFININDVSGKDRRILASPPPPVPFSSFHQLTHRDLWESSWVASTVTIPNIPTWRRKMYR